jgi:hypothetical protein
MVGLQNLLKYRDWKEVIDEFSFLTCLIGLSISYARKDKDNNKDAVSKLY